MTAQRDIVGRPDQAQEYLGRQLRRLRESQGISRQEAGQHIGGSEPKISRIELGRSRVKEDDLEALLTFYGVTNVHVRRVMVSLARQLIVPQWWHQYSGSMSGWFCSYLTLEAMVLASASETIRTYESRFIPGLLQTRAYAQALVGMHFPDAQELRQRVEVRVRRRQTALDQLQRHRFMGRTPRPWIWAIIDESALNERIGGPGVMRDQIRFLIHAVRKLNCRIQILPSGTGGLTGVGNSFSILRLDGSRALPDIVYIEHIGGAHFLHEPNEVEPYRFAVERLGATALEPGDTLTELEKAMRRLAL